MHDLDATTLDRQLNIINATTISAANLASCNQVGPLYNEALHKGLCLNGVVNGAILVAAGLLASCLLVIIGISLSSAYWPGDLVYVSGKQDKSLDLVPRGF